MPESFDVFLSHNSKDKPAVREIAEALRKRRLRVWLDEDELVPGRPWQEAIEQAILACRSAAVLVGKDGLGPWEIPEMRASLDQMVKRKLPVIPVLLPGAPEAPDLPLFLAGNTWVDLREGLSDDGLERLRWGVTGEKKAKTAKKAHKLPTPTPPHLHNLPFLPLGDLFKGRAEDLKALEASLQSSSQATVIVQPHAIHGLGGIGKTRLAVEYAWHSGHRYDTVLFVVADSPESLYASLAALESRLDLPVKTSSAQEEVVAAILDWLRRHQRWLLILDNVDTPEAEQAVVDLLPQLRGGHVLITSRRKNWPPAIQKQSISKLTHGEATYFLLQRTEEARSQEQDDPEKAAELAKLLDGLPLALEQAAAYVAHHQMSFAEYLEGWELGRDEALSWYDKSVMQYPASLAATWQTTYLQLGHTAKAILRLTAYLASDPIPTEMFVTANDRVERAVGLLCEETGQEPVEQTVKAALAELASYSMITRAEKTATVHRMVQEVMRSRVPEDRQRDWIEASLGIVNDFSPSEPLDFRTWVVWDAIRSHVRQVSEAADRASITEPTTRLLGDLANLLHAKGLYAEAEPLIRRALKIDEAAYGSQHPKVAIHLNNLAQLLQDTNRLAEAEPMMRRALEIDEDAHGSQHPNVAIHLNNLAQLLKATNRLAEAEPMMRRALEIDEDAYGSQHPRVAIDLNNLAQLLKATNRLSEAEPMMRRALEIDEDAYGSQHPRVAIDLNNLAQLLKATNRLSEAEPMMRRALEIDEAAYGSQHPSIARDLNNLAQLLQDTNRLAEAEPMMRRALEIDEDAYGSQHPEVATDLNNLALLLKATNRLSEAEPMMRRAVEIFEQSLGPDHPTTQLGRENLEILLQEIAESDEKS